MSASALPPQSPRGGSCSPSCAGHLVSSGSGGLGDRGCTCPGERWPGHPWEGFFWAWALNVQGYCK